MIPSGSRHSKEAIFPTKLGTFSALYCSLKLKVGGTAKVPQLRRFCLVMKIER